MKVIYREPASIVFFVFVLVFWCKQMFSCLTTFAYLQSLEMLHNYKLIDYTQLYNTLRIVMCYYSASVSVSVPLVLLLTSDPSCPVETTRPVAAAPVSDI